MKVVFSRNRVAHLGLLLSLSALVAEVPKREPASAQSMIRAHSTRARIPRGARRARSSDAQRSDGARRAAERDDAIAPPPPQVLRHEAAIGLWVGRDSRVPDQFVHHVLQRKGEKAEGVGGRDGREGRGGREAVESEEEEQLSLSS